MFPYSIQQSISEMKGQADESIQQDERGSAAEHPPAAAGMLVCLPPGSSAPTHGNRGKPVGQ